MSKAKRRIRRNSASNTSTDHKGNVEFSSFPRTSSALREHSRGRTCPGRPASTIPSMDRDSEYLVTESKPRNHQPVHLEDLFGPPRKLNRRVSNVSSSVTSDPQVFSSDHGLDDDSSETEMEPDGNDDDDDDVSRYRPLKLYSSAVNLEHTNSQDTVRDFEDLRSVESTSGPNITSTKLSLRPLTYSSLPATPISVSPPLASPVSESFQSNFLLSQPPFSLWDYLREELLATDFDSHQEMKWERVSNFLNIPFAIEKVRQSPCPRSPLSSFIVTQAAGPSR
jgi:hypothetical protein